MANAISPITRVKLPTVRTPSAITNGRVVAEGYQRGWGIQYGDLKKQIETDDLFARSLASAEIHSLVSPERRMNLFLIITQFLQQLDGQDIVEFGTYQGGNALFMALVLREIAPGANVFALDTYEGMPDTDITKDAHAPGAFGDANLEIFTRRIETLGLANLHPVKGLFKDTFPALAAERRFGLAHIDADIYSAVKYAQDAVWPCMWPGGYVVYDDATDSSYIGATEAVEEMMAARGVHSEQIWPHFVFRVGL